MLLSPSLGFVGSFWIVAFFPFLLPSFPFLSFSSVIVQVKSCYIAQIGFKLMPLLPQYPRAGLQQVPARVLFACFFVLLGF